MGVHPLFYIKHSVTGNLPLIYNPLKDGLSALHT